MIKPYRIEFVRSARKEFVKLPKQIQSKVVSALELLATNPFSELIKFKKIKGAADLYRIRIGDYRIIYAIQNEVLKVVVIKIGHRKEVYRGF